VLYYGCRSGVVIGEGKRRKAAMVPYIPVHEAAIAGKVRLGAEYVRQAIQLLEERLPVDEYRLVADADVAILAVALATATEEEIVEGIVGLIERQIRACQQ
jgi:hypothetical protein